MVFSTPLRPGGLILRHRYHTLLGFDNNNKNNSSRRATRVDEKTDRRRQHGDSQNRSSSPVCCNFLLLSSTRLVAAETGKNSSRAVVGVINGLRWRGEEVEEVLLPITVNKEQVLRILI